MAQQIQDLGLHGYIQGGGGLVSDQHAGVIGGGQGDAGALQLATGKLVRVGVSDPLSFTLISAQPSAAKGVKHLGAHGAALASRSAFAFTLAVDSNGFGDLVADGKQRIQGGGGFLEDHAHMFATRLIQNFTRSPHQFLVLAAAVQYGTAAN